MSKLQKDIKKFLNVRTVIIIFIFLIASLIWGEYITGFILLAVFAPLTFFTVRYSKMVPHISIESFTSTAIFMGYVFNPGIGFLYGWSIGTFSYVANSYVNALYLSNPVLAGIAAVIAGVLKGFGVSFPVAFFIAVVIRTMIAYPWFGILGADPIERFTHQASQFFSNLIIYLPLLNVLYGFVA